MEIVKCNRCASLTCVKSGFESDKQRYRCKICGRRFYNVKAKRSKRNRHLHAVRLYTEGVSIRGIGRLLHVSHVTVLKWLKHMAQKLKMPTPLYAKHIEIDELYFYVGSKKQKRWLWLAVCRNTKRILGFCTGDRGSKTLAKLMHRISPIKCERYYTDKHAPFAKVIPEEKHCSRPNETNTIEGINSAVRHYLTRFKRRSKCYSKSVQMVEASIILLMHSLNSSCKYYF